MNRRTLATGLAIVGIVAGSLAAAQSGASAATATKKPQPTHTARLCPAAVPRGFMTCFAEQVIGVHGVLDGPPASALTPAQLQDAYNLDGLQSHGRTVAIVDAFGYPNLERDLGVFRDYFGLPPCTTANGCLTIMDQRGGSDLPPFNLGWAGEQALDVDAVSSACPDCKIVVVQSDTNSLGNLARAVRTAAKQPGVVAISNSYGGHDSKDANWGKYYHQPGIAVTASTGDSGFQGAQYPSSSQWVTAVGGTALFPASNKRGWDETAWVGAGSGCSRFNVKIEAQQGYHTSCLGMRAASDVSAAASPSRGGLAWYGPSSEQDSRWGQVGGTSESSPIIASVYALSGNTKGNANEIPYGDPSHLFDITEGANGTCDPMQICTARKGWDGPTGLGTPNGAGSF